MAFHGELVAALDVFVSNANSNLAALLQAELGETVAQYQLLKERNGKLDFLDLLIRARNLLVQSPSVRKHFQERFTHLFVDEFQDTDPLQAEIIVLLSASDPDANNWRGVAPVPGKNTVGIEVPNAQKEKVLSLIHILMIAAAACPVVFAPAMNNRMWENPVATENRAKLQRLGYRFIGPDDGWLACRNTGPGRLSEPGKIVEEVTRLLAQTMETVMPKGQRAM